MQCTPHGALHAADAALVEGQRRLSHSEYVCKRFPRGLDHDRKQKLTREFVENSARMPFGINAKQTVRNHNQTELSTALSIVVLSNKMLALFRLKGAPNAFNIVTC